MQNLIHYYDQIITDQKTTHLKQIPQVVLVYMCDNVVFYLGGGAIYLLEWIIMYVVSQNNDKIL